MNTIRSERRAPSRVRWNTEPVGASAAAVCALVLWLALTLSGVDLAVRTGETVRQVGGVDVALTAFAAGLIGLFALRLLERFTARALSIWTAIAVTVLVLSYAGALAALTTTGTMSLIALHSVVGAVVITTGRRSRLPRR